MHLICYIHLTNDIQKYVIDVNLMINTNTINLCSNVVIGEKVSNAIKTIQKEEYLVGCTST